MKPLEFDPEQHYDLTTEEAKHKGIEWARDAARETGEDWVMAYLDGRPTFLSSIDNLPAGAYVIWNTNCSCEVWKVTLTMRRKLGEDASNLAECIADIIEEHYKGDLRHIEVTPTARDHYEASWNGDRHQLRFIFNKADEVE